MIYLLRTVTKSYNNAKIQTLEVKKAMQYQNFVDNIDAQTIDKLQTAVEIGRWENGDKLTDKQRDSAMQAVMLWQANNQQSGTNEPFKVNSKGEFKIGKGEALKNTPPEFQSNDDPNLIFKSKD